MTSRSVRPTTILVVLALLAVGSSSALAGTRLTARTKARTIRRVSGVVRLSLIPRRCSHLSPKICVNRTLEDQG